MHWFEALTWTRSRREPAVLVTLIAVRGHAPREAGAKMVVSADQVWDTVGGGNLEQAAVVRARQLLNASEPLPQPEQLTLPLNDRAPAEHGVQCCGGEVTLLLEPMPVPPVIAIIGMGHVGWELAHLLNRHNLELHLVDSRAAQVDPERVAALQRSGGQAQLHARHAPVPESVLAQLPPGAHVLVMTHDHAEDLAVCDSALRSAHLGSVGVIGSRAKWTRFVARLEAEGHDRAAIDEIRCPIGDPTIVGKRPEVVALSIGTELVTRLSAVKVAR
ncbi:xanthine dehydrogenase accessory protein XdhC [Dermacoccaceae bacterium W4C1]